VLLVLAYLADALDGSQISRERDTLAADCDDHLQDSNAAQEEIRRGLAEIAEIRETLNAATLGQVCDTVQEAVDAVYSPYNSLRMLIGGPSAEPLKPVGRSLATDASTGRPVGWIGTSLPGARRVDLAPLFDRCARLAAIDKQRADLKAALDALPEHPRASDF